MAEHPTQYITFTYHSPRASRHLIWPKAKSRSSGFISSFFWYAWSAWSQSCNFSCQRSCTFMSVRLFFLAYSRRPKVNVFINSRNTSNGQLTLLYCTFVLLIKDGSWKPLAKRAVMQRRKIGGEQNAPNFEFEAVVLHALSLFCPYNGIWQASIPALHLCNS